ncbi:hypothetical protein M0811_00193 [Anaeramoeba ignava]|uniref:Mediator complex subunit Med12 LCEWAV-domain domain-containing protein n=1 Tax=Anaeramoeba ignava TaxID=1746090 RepID=A0A9Q0LS22_ANAIG|nr:hypothetical protein M0811_00193 [Anaeramoeba ignava]
MAIYCFQNGMLDRFLFLKEIIQLFRYSSSDENNSALMLIFLNTLDFICENFILLDGFINVCLKKLSLIEQHNLHLFQNKLVKEVSNFSKMENQEITGKRTKNFGKNNLLNQQKQSNKINFAARNIITKGIPNAQKNNSNDQAEKNMDIEQEGFENSANESANENEQDTQSHFYITSQRLKFFEQIFSVLQYSIYHAFDALSVVGVENLMKIKTFSEILFTIFPKQIFQLDSSMLSILIQRADILYQNSHLNFFDECSLVESLDALIEKGEAKYYQLFQSKGFNNFQGCPQEFGILSNEEQDKSVNSINLVQKENSDDFRFVSIICEWVVTRFRYIPYRNSIAIKVLTEYAQYRQQKDPFFDYSKQDSFFILQKPLLNFLDSYSPSVKEEKRIEELFGEFIRTDLFSHNLYSRRLISLGLFRIQKQQQDKLAQKRILFFKMIPTVGGFESKDFIHKMVLLEREHLKEAIQNEREAIRKGEELALRFLNSGEDFHTLLNHFNQFNSPFYIDQINTRIVEFVHNNIEKSQFEKDGIVVRNEILLLEISNDYQRLIDELLWLFENTIGFEKQLVELMQKYRGVFVLRGKVVELLMALIKKSEIEKEPNINTNITPNNLPMNILDLKSMIIECFRFICTEYHSFPEITQYLNHLLENNSIDSMIKRKINKILDSKTTNLAKSKHFKSFDFGKNIRKSQNQQTKANQNISQLVSQLPNINSQNMIKEFSNFFLTHSNTFTLNDLFIFYSSFITKINSREVNLYIAIQIFRELNFLSSSRIHHDQILLYVFKNQVMVFEKFTGELVAQFTDFLLRIISLGMVNINQVIAGVFQECLETESKKLIESYSQVSKERVAFCLDFLVSLLSESTEKLENNQYTSITLITTRFQIMPGVLFSLLTSLWRILMKFEGIFKANLNEDENENLNQNQINLQNLINLLKSTLVKITNQDNFRHACIFNASELHSELNKLDESFLSKLKLFALVRKAIIPEKHEEDIKDIKDMKDEENLEKENLENENENENENGNENGNENENENENGNENENEKKSFVRNKLCSKINAVLNRTTIWTTSLCSLELQLLLEYQKDIIKNESNTTKGGDILQLQQDLYAEFANAILERILDRPSYTSLFIRFELGKNIRKELFDKIIKWLSDLENALKPPSFCAAQTIGDALSQILEVCLQEKDADYSYLFMSLLSQLEKLTELHSSGKLAAKNFLSSAHLRIRLLNWFCSFLSESRVLSGLQSQERTNLAISAFKLAHNLLHILSLVSQIHELECENLFNYFLDVFTSITSITSKTLLQDDKSSSRILKEKNGDLWNYFNSLQFGHIHRDRIRKVLPYVKQNMFTNSSFMKDTSSDLLFQIAYGIPNPDRKDNLITLPIKINKPTLHDPRQIDPWTILEAYPESYFTPLVLGGKRLRNPANNQKWDRNDDIVL